LPEEDNLCPPKRAKTLAEHDSWALEENAAHAAADVHPLTRAKTLAEHDSWALEENECHAAADVHPAAAPASFIINLDETDDESDDDEAKTPPPEPNCTCGALDNQSGRRFFKCDPLCPRYAPSFPSF
jgi:hypothetical protein